MSLGFLTESALLPSKAKKINVDGTSLIDLKAIVYEKEQKLSQGETKSLRKKRGRQHEPPSSYKEKAVSDENPGVKERSAKDEEAHRKEKLKSKRAKEILQRKAAVYEKMASGKLQDHEETFLVNFAQKPVSMQTKDDDNKEEEDVEIEDEFGRARTVSTKSKEYKEWLAVEKERKSLEDDSNPPCTIASTEASAGPWAWSRGDATAGPGGRPRHDVGEWRRRPAAAAAGGDKPVFDFSEPLEEDQSKGPHTLSAGARVVSQWERSTLAGKARAHLEEVHREAARGRAAAEGRAEEKRRRRELLRQKQMKRLAGGRVSMANSTNNNDHKI